MLQAAFFVPGIPKAQPRPRAFAKRVGGGRFEARVYDPSTAEGWKSLIATEAKKHIPETPFEGPVAMRMVFYLPRPKDHFRKNGDLKETAPGYMLSKPDLDNLEKAVKDALTLLGFWKDDKQVIFVTKKKTYAKSPFDEPGDPANPGMFLAIAEYNE